MKKDVLFFFDFQNNSLFKKYDDTNNCNYQFLINDFVVDERESTKKLIGFFYQAHIKI